MDTKWENLALSYLFIADLVLEQMPGSVILQPILQTSTEDRFLLFCD